MYIYIYWRQQADAAETEAGLHREARRAVEVAVGREAQCRWISKSIIGSTR